MNISFKSGDTFAGCRLLSQSGRGAYGVVFLAENPLGQRVIIKIVENSDNSARELKGLKLYTRMSEYNPHLLRVFHTGEFQDGFYYTMEVADNLNGEEDPMFRRLWATCSAGARSSPPKRQEGSSENCLSVLR